MKLKKAICKLCFFSVFFTIALISSGCSLFLIQWTDPRKEQLEGYTAAWLDKKELILAYKTDNESRWQKLTFIEGDIDLDNIKTSTGEPPMEVIKSKRQIPIMKLKKKTKVNPETEKSTAHIENVLLVKDSSKHYRYLKETGIKAPKKITAKSFILIGFSGYTNEDIHTSIPSPTMKEYRPLWCYPTRAFLYPITLSLDTATAPIWITAILFGDREGFTLFK